VAFHVQEDLLLFERDSQFFEGAEHFGVGVLEAVEGGLHPGGGVVDDVLDVDGLIADVGPGGIAFHGEEVAIGLEAPVEHPLGLALFLGDAADDVFVQAGLEGIGIDVGGEAPLVVALGPVFEELVVFGARFGRYCSIGVLRYCGASSVVLRPSSFVLLSFELGFHGLVCELQARGPGCEVQPRAPLVLSTLHFGR